MITQIYLMRHSEPLKALTIYNNDTLQLQNEKWPLTKNGEKIALNKSYNSELQNFDIVISSSYVRAVATAKYFTNSDLYIDENFRERKFGIDSWEEKPKEFEAKQFKDFNYKLENGESLNEVMERQYKPLKNILEKYKGKKILIVGHSTALASLLSKWCNINYNENYTFNNKSFFNGKWDYCQTFKLEFEENKLLSIKDIK